MHGYYETAQSCSYPESSSVGTIRQMLTSVTGDRASRRSRVVPGDARATLPAVRWWCVARDAAAAAAAAPVCSPLSARCRGRASARRGSASATPAGRRTCRATAPRRRSRVGTGQADPAAASSDLIWHLDRFSRVCRAHGHAQQTDTQDTTTERVAASTDSIECT